jgi:hypothetical protein
MGDKYNMKDSRFFNTEKNKTNEFFKDTRVASCSHIVVRNGVSVAVPFKITNQKGKPLNHFKYVPTKSAEVESIYRKDYSIKPYMHVGMVKKPLVKYEPDSYRNRLPSTGIIMSHKNKSIVEIGDRG